MVLLLQPFIERDPCIVNALAKAQFAGIDRMKFIAALLVIANHTGPLLQYNEYADFLLSGVISRIAVPFFFMASGFFFFRKLTGDKAADRRALLRYSKNVGWLYGISILIYLPLNVYTGYFTEDFSLSSFIKDIVFNGTLYHLWYLPALLIGLFIVYFLYEKSSLTFMLLCAALLYIIGLLGDSYYGIADQISGLTTVYDKLFLCFDYTRNGLFFAPLFLALGASAVKKTESQLVRKSTTYASLFSLFLVMMMGEALLLQAWELPRHNSMYIISVPAVYALFQWALLWKRQTERTNRELRVWIYILHPLAIVLLRGAAKAVSLEAVFITNSLVHYVTVCLLSIAMAAAAVRLSIIKIKLRP
nr:acyltransferase family protein [Paenibacillus castaneae]